MDDGLKAVDDVSLLHDYIALLVLWNNNFVLYFQKQDEQDKVCFIYDR